MPSETAVLPQLRIRGRSLMALILVPEPPIAGWIAALDAQMLRAAGYFVQKPVVVNLAALQGVPTDVLILLEALHLRGLSVVGLEGLERGGLAGTRFEMLAELRPKDEGEDRDLVLPEAAPDPEPEPAPPTALLIDRPVRSGQAIVFEQGDVTIIGAVASGAEIVAGGSVHVYGPVRGRVIAGVKDGAKARIFCRRLSAELLAIDGVYGTADEWNKGFEDRAVQIRLNGGALGISILD